MALSPALAPLVHTRERIYYAILVAVSLLVYTAILAVMVASPAAAAGVGFYVVMIPLMLFVFQAMWLGRVRGNGIRITPRQFPELYAMAQKHVTTLGIDQMPDIFLVESGGVLNALATRFLGRNFVIIHSDVLAMAEQEGGEAVSFIVAHELAHVRRGHTRHRWLIAPGTMVPYLGAAYSRACEYTCDRFGAHCAPEGAVRGLLALAAGPALYRRVNVAEYAGQVESEKGFWISRVELMSTHPRPPKRVAALLAAGVPAPGVSAPPGAGVGQLLAGGRTQYS